VCIILKRTAKPKCTGAPISRLLFHVGDTLTSFVAHVTSARVVGVRVGISVGRILFCFTSLCWLAAELRGWCVFSSAKFFSLLWILPYGRGRY